MTGVLCAGALAAQVSHKRLEAAWQSPTFWHRCAAPMAMLPFIALLYAAYLYIEDGVLEPRRLSVFLFATTMLVGFALIAAGRPRRMGDSFHCDVCDYERRTDSPVCSECGYDWLAPHGVVQGERQVQWPAVWAGLLIMLAPPLSQTLLRYTSLDVQRLILSALPTRILIDAATTGSPYGADEEFKILVSRSLSAEQEARLARRLLDQHLEYKRRSGPAAAWLEPNVLSATLPSDICERFFTEMAEIRLIVTDTVIVGQPLAFYFDSRERSHGKSSTLKCEVYFGGVSADGGATFTERATRRARAAWFDAIWWVPGKPPRQVLDTKPPPLVVFDSPGEHEITCRLWQAAVLRTDYTDKIDWLDDGSPEFPPAVVWSKQIDLTATIEALPASGG